MISTIMLVINGDIFLFEDNGLTLEQKDSLRSIADDMAHESTINIDAAEEEVSKRFIVKVKSCLGINLVHIPVSFVVRINFSDHRIQTSDKQ